MFAENKILIYELQVDTSVLRFFLYCEYVNGYLKWERAKGVA